MNVSAVTLDSRHHALLLRDCQASSRQHPYLSLIYEFHLPEELSLAIAGYILDCVVYLMYDAEMGRDLCKDLAIASGKLRIVHTFY